MNPNSALAGGGSTLHPLVGSRRASIRLAGAPAFLAGLTDSDHVPHPVEKALTPLVLVRVAEKGHSATVRDMRL